MPRTVGDVIDAALRRLRMRSNPTMDVLGAALDASETLVSVSSPSLQGVGPGDIIQVDRELMYVLDVEEPSYSQATVIRGYADTAKVPHAVGAMVEVSPRFSREDALEALLSTVRSWKSLYYVDVTSGTTTTEGSHAIALHEPPDDQLQVLALRYQNTDGLWVSVNSGIEFIDSVPDAAGGANTWLQLQPDLIDRPIPNGTKIWVHYARAFRTTQITEATQYENVMHIPESYEDFMVFGIMWRLLAPEEGINQDLDAWRQSRVVEDVPPGSVIQTATIYKQLHDERASEEEYALARRWGWTGRG